MKNVLEWLETTVEKYPDKPAFSDTECSITFAQVYDIARNTGAYLIEQLGVDRTPVAVFAGRKMVTPAYFLGVVYAGRPYAPIDASLPDKRIEKILENPQVIKTPVVRNGKQSTLGYLPDVWKNWN